MRGSTSSASLFNAYQAITLAHSSHAKARMQKGQRNLGPVFGSNQDWICAKQISLAGFPWTAQQQQASEIPTTWQPRNAGQRRPN